MRRSRPTLVVLRALLVTVIAVAATGSGCGDSKDSETSKKSKAPQKGATAGKARPVPASLGRVESGAEDIIDYAHAGGRAKVVATARSVRRTADGPAARDLRRAGVQEERIAALRDRARLLQSLAPRADLARVSLAANQISALMPELYSRYKDPVPPDVLKLDYLDREAQLRSLAGDEPSVPPAVNDLSSTWTRLRPRVIEAGGRAVAARYTRHVVLMRRLARGSDPPALQKEAASGLELVDELEHRFRKR